MKDEGGKMTLAKGQRVKLVQPCEYYGWKYSAGQSGKILWLTETKAVIDLDGYEEARAADKKFKQETGEFPNLSEYVIEIPVSLLAMA